MVVKSLGFFGIMITAQESTAGQYPPEDTMSFFESVTSQYNVLFNASASSGLWLMRSFACCWYLKWRDPTLQWVALQTASKIWVLRVYEGFSEFWRILDRNGRITVVFNWPRRQRRNWNLLLRQNSCNNREELLFKSLMHAHLDGRCWNSTVGIFYLRLFLTNAALGVKILLTTLGALE